MPTRSVDLSDHFDRFVESGVDSGRFGNVSEVVREGLRLLEERERDEAIKLQWLREAVQEGFDAVDRGDFLEIGSEEDLASLMRSIHGEVVSEMSSDRSGV